MEVLKGTIVIALGAKSEAVLTLTGFSLVTGGLVFRLVPTAGVDGDGEVSNTVSGAEPSPDGSEFFTVSLMTVAWESFAEADSCFWSGGSTVGATRTGLWGGAGSYRILHISNRNWAERRWRKDHEVGSQIRETRSTTGCNTRIS